MQARRALPLLLAAALLPVCALAQGPLAEARVRPDLSTRTSPVVPLRLLQGYSVVVQGRLGAADKARTFLIDTGSNPSVIDGSIAREFGLRGQDVRLALMNGQVELQAVELPWLELGPLRREKLRVLVRDLGYIQAELGVRVDAVVGMDVLSGSNFTIDYQHRQLRFDTPATDDEETADFISGPPLMVVGASEGQAPLKLLVDTGTSGILLFNRSVHGRLGEGRAGGRADGFNMRGGFSVQQMVLADLHLGNRPWGAHRAFLLDDRRGWGDTFDGLLGPTALGLKRITFDFVAGKLRWKR